MNKPTCSECGGDCDNILGSCKELITKPYWKYDEYYEVWK